MRKVGIVNYLNTTPLVFALQQKLIDHNYALLPDVPSRLADDLKEGIIDLALIPVIEYARSHEPYAIVPDICIGATGAVASVSLFFNKELNDIKKVALDTSSRTSAALTKIILAEKFGIKPDFIPMAPNLDLMLKSADAALLIGDKALKAGVENYNHFDLAEEWTDWTGLPFVFAVWAGIKNDWNMDQLAPLFKSKKIGLTKIKEISIAYASTAGHKPEFYENYFLKNIQYDLTEDHIEGMKAFFELAFYHGLIDNIPDVEFFSEILKQDNTLDNFVNGKKG